MPAFHIINFGCRANQADGAALQAELSSRGMASAPEPGRADLVILNSCTVTAGADFSLRNAVRRMHRENPAARIVVTGCYAQRSPQELAGLPGVEFVVGNSHKSEIVRLVSAASSSPAAAPVGASDGNGLPIRAATVRERALTAQNYRQLIPLGALGNPSAGQPRSHFPPGAAQVFHSDIFAHTEPLSSPLRGEVWEDLTRDRTRPNLKIQDGCNNRCSFCIIPYVRGRSRSLPLTDVLQQVRAFCQAGYREVVLSGINLGRYGRDLHFDGSDLGGNAGLRLPQLVRAILNETPLERLRLSSVEPMDFTNELLDLMASSPRIAKHIHAPLQSGSERILRLMHRRYHPHNYRNRIEAAFERMPNAAYGADVMVGFPGESDSDFEETRSFIESLPFTYLHVFPFSRRPGTPADKMEGQVHGTAIRERARILRELAAEKNLRFRRRQFGREMKVVTLSEPRPLGIAAETCPDSTSALSDNFLNVWIAGERLPANQLIEVKIAGIHDDGLVGERNPSVIASYF